MLRYRRIQNHSSMLYGIQTIEMTVYNIQKCILCYSIYNRKMQNL